MDGQKMACTEPRGLIGCAVLRGAIEPLMYAATDWDFVEFLDAGLHTTPTKLRPALQDRLDMITTPSRIFLAYGLCGNGLEGLRSGKHTLIIPRNGDCIPLLMGSYQQYAADLQENPGTYYLSEGWLENDFHPIGQYSEWLQTYNEKTARRLLELYFKHYRRVLLLGYTKEELDRGRNLAGEGAEFLGLAYAEKLSSPRYLQHLLKTGMDLTVSNEDLLLIPPGGETTSIMFIRELEHNHTAAGGK
ncbi:MAG: DUF1638 domain-containing protein [Anaerolineales bacterium]|nr:DUF1638 domain-containing protein [Anaerolineales bacterium]